MAYSTNPVTANPVPSSNNDNNEGKNKKTWYIVLIVALLGTWAYLIYDNEQNNRK